MIAAGIAGRSFYLRSRNSEVTTIGSIAVLPFVNASGDPNTEYLSDGITESIISSLSQLRVMARSTVFSYKGKDVDPLKVGHDLGVRAVLMGRLIQQGDNLTIRTELVNVADGTELWGQQYNRKLADDKPEGTSEQVIGYASVGSCSFPLLPLGEGPGKRGVADDRREP